MAAPTIAAHTPTTAGHAHIDAVIHRGGPIMIGTMKPIRVAAVAHDGHTTLAMLRCKPNQPLAEILGRLDGAIAIAMATGQRVDEVNRPSASCTYEY
jgi:hypothetical protein